MKKFITTSVFLFILLAALTGCGTFSVRYEDFDTAKMPAQYPFKLYLKDIRIGLYRNDKLDMEPYPALKKTLIKNYPQYFTSEQHGHPACELLLIRRDVKARESEAALLFLSIPTLGLIPAMDTVDFQWKLTVNTGNFKTEHKIKCKRGHTVTPGILGAILQTHRLLTVDGAHDVNQDGIFLDHKSKYLHKVILDAFNKIDRDKLMEYYNTNYADKTELLE